MASTPLIVRNLVSQLKFDFGKVIIPLVPYEQKNVYLSEFQTRSKIKFWKTTFPMSNSNYETGFWTRRGVLAFRNGLIFSIRRREGTFPDCVLNLLSKIRTKYWKKKSERQPSRSQTPIMRPDFELERGYLLYKSILSQKQRNDHGFSLAIVISSDGEKSGHGKKSGQMPFLASNKKTKTTFV